MYIASSSLITSFIKWRIILWKKIAASRRTINDRLCTVCLVTLDNQHQGSTGTFVHFSVKHSWRCLTTIRFQFSPARRNSQWGCTPTESHAMTTSRIQQVFSTTWTMRKSRTPQRRKILICLFCTQLFGEGGCVEEMKHVVAPNKHEKTGIMNI